MFKRFLTTTIKSKSILKNSNISSKTIFLISHNGNELGLKDLNSSLKSLKQGYELIQVSSSSPIGREVPTVKEFLIAPKKPEKVVKNNSQVKIKKMEIMSNIDQHDKTIKVNKILGFLDKGYQVKVALSRKKGPQKDKNVSSLFNLLESLLQDLKEFKHNVEKESFGKMELIFFPKRG